MINYDPALLKFNEALIAVATDIKNNPLSRVYYSPLILSLADMMLEFLEKESIENLNDECTKNFGI
jgi:hypothetical protein